MEPYEHQNHQNQFITFPSLQRQIKMPNSININPQQSVFNPIDSITQSKDLSNQLKFKLTDVYRILNQTFYYYENPDKHLFKFPQSKFQAIPQGHVNDINYQRHINFVPENTFRDHLSPEQLQQISAKGQFQVKSPNPRVTMPYIWKINDYLFKGSENVILTWKKGLASIYDTFNFGRNSLIKRIPDQLSDLAKLPKRFFSLIFGKKMMVKAYNIDYNRQVSKDFLSQVFEQILTKQKGWGKQFWDYLYVPYESRFDQVIQGGTKAEREQRQRIKQRDIYQNDKIVKIRQQRVNQIQKIDQQFQKMWLKNRKKIMTGLVNDYSQRQRMIQQPMIRQGQRKSQEEQKMIKNHQKQNQKKILNELRNRKYAMYIDWIRNQLPKKNVPRDVIETIIILLNLFQALRAKNDGLQEDLGNLKVQVQQNIKKQYPILSLSSRFSRKQQNKKYLSASNTYTNNFYQALLRDPQFVRNTSQAQKKIYQKYLVYRNQWDIKVQNKKKEIKELESPRRVFDSYYLCLPPYEVIQTNYEGQPTNFSLRKEQRQQSDTSFHFWKCCLYAMRLKCWTINCFVFLVGAAFLGPTGLRCLCGIQDFSYDENINYLTGAKIPVTRQTVLGVFKQVLKGISDSRDNFEALPDTGLFGKRFSRVCNLLECYLFRFLFVGVILVLILYPIAIILSFCIISILAITVWIWVPLVMVLVYLFNIFIYQFESGYIPVERYDNCCDSCCGGCCIRAFPLVSLILVFFKCVFLIFVYILHILVTPLLMLLFFILRVLQIVFTTIRDKIMYCLIACLGRTPSNDTAIAWKISGPGMARSFYNSVHEEDVYILTQCKLEMIYNEAVFYQYRNKIRKHQNFYKNVMKQVLKPYTQNSEAAVINTNVIEKNANALNSNFEKQYQQHMKRFPQMPRNVRFTKEQIESFFPNTIRIVQKFVEKEGLGQWIFDKYNMANGSYEQLANVVWISVFGTPQIFEPLQKIDQRFKLVDAYQDQQEQYYSKGMKKNVGSVMRALQGQVDLKRTRPQVRRFKHGILQRDANIQLTRSLTNIYISNSGRNVSFSKDNFLSPFIPHLNIDQCKQFETYQYERFKRLNPKAAQARD